MVKETRIVFEIGDVVKVTLKCTGQDCGGEISDTLDKLVRLTQCPLCGDLWEDPGPSSSSVLQALRALRELLRDQSPSRVIRFEIDGEEDK